MRSSIPALWALGVVLGSGLAGRSSAAELSLPALTRQADRIYAGTVRETRSHRDPGSGLVFTDVRFGDLEVLKLGQGAGGRGPGTAVLRVAGGRDIDGTFVQVSGVPRFLKGERYLVFEKQGAGTFCPLVGWEDGCFRLARDGARGRVVLDARDTPVVALRGGRIERPRPPRSAETQNLFSAAVPGAQKLRRAGGGPLTADPASRSSGGPPEITRYTGAAGRRMATAARPAPPRGAMPAAAFLAAVRRAVRGH